MYNNPDVPADISSPVLLDKAIQALQTELSTISWMGKAFGRAREAYEIRDGLEFIYPEIYIGNSEYLSMMPNDTIEDAYCFFVADDPQYMEDGADGPGFGIIRAPVSLIVYFNLEQIDSTKTYYFSEELKKDVLAALKRGDPMVAVEVRTIYEKISNVFEGYTIDRARTQLYKHPYGGMRFELDVIFNEQC